jgi:pSer/pThr/pTyr-binding forkhead associated (FHA) protein
MSNPDSPLAPLDHAPLEDVIVQLLDAALGRTVKTWKFSDRDSITIGRQPDCDVEISDAYVSRLHAELRRHNGQWQLIARGRSGVAVRNQSITELPIDSEVTFQLGSSGPVLRFAVSHEDVGCAHTLFFEPQPLPSFALDETKIHDEVGQIAEGDYFQRLQEQAKSLRAQRGR